MSTRNSWGLSGRLLMSIYEKGHKVFLNDKRHGLPVNILKFSALLQEGLT